jgi:hypothetical protein
MIIKYSNEFIDKAKLSALQSAPSQSAKSWIFLFIILNKSIWGRLRRKTSRKDIFLLDCK